MRALLTSGLVLLVALVGAACGDEGGGVPCCGDDVETPERGILEPRETVVADPTEVQVEFVVKDAPTIRCEDGAVDFGEEVVGMSVPARRVTCLNEGDTIARSLAISSSDPAFTAALLADAVPPGASFEIEIGFAPPWAGQHAAEITLFAGPGSEETKVSTVGSAIELAPCSLTMLPDPAVGLDFRRVQAGSRSTQDLVLRNGDGACAIRDLSIVGPGDVWSSVATENPSFMLDPWTDLRIPIAFHPDRAGDFAASLHFRVSDPGAVDRVVPLTGKAVDDCLTIPDDLRLTSSEPFCMLVTETIQVRNECDEPVVFLGVGTPAPGFVVADQPATPTTIAPGASFDLELAFVDLFTGVEIHGGFSLAFEGRGDRWLQATVVRGPWDAQVDTFLVPTPPTDTFVLRRRPVVGDAIADFLTMEVDGETIPPVFQGAGMWTYDATLNAIVLNEYYLPVPGSVVEISYLPTCL